MSLGLGKQNFNNRVIKMKVNFKFYNLNNKKIEKSFLIFEKNNDFTNIKYKYKLILNNKCFIFNFGKNFKNKIINIIKDNNNYIYNPIF